MKSNTGSKLNKELGATIIEAALVTPLLFTVVFSLIIFFIYMAQSVSLQYALDHTLRDVTIGRVNRNGLRLGLSPYNEQDIVDITINNAKRFNVNLNPENIFICPPAFPRCNDKVIVDSSSPIVLRVDKPFSWFGFNLRGMAYGRME